MLSGNVRWLLATLATFRLAWAIINYQDRWNLALRLRARFGCYDRNVHGEIRTHLGRFLTCPYCVGLWAALPMALVALFPSTPGDVILAWLGLAGGVMVLARWRNWDF